MTQKAIVRYLTYLCPFLMFALVAHAQQVNTLNGAVRVPNATKAAQGPALLNRSTEKFTYYGIAVWKRLPDKQAVKELNTKGIYLESWVEKSTYIVKVLNKEVFESLTGPGSANQTSYLGIIHLGDVPAALKYSRDINDIASGLKNKNTLLSVSISVYDSQFIGQLKQYCAESGLLSIANRGTDERTTLSVSGVDKVKLTALAGLNYVRSIESYSDATPLETATPNLRGIIDNQIFAVNYDTAHSYIGRNTYSGNIETVSSTDKETLTRFRNRLILSTIDYTGDMTSHARATSAVMAGGNNFDEVIDRGIAPGTKGLAQAYWDVSLVMNNYNNGIHPLSVNSSFFVFPTGNSANSVYNGTTAAWDEAIRSVPDLMFGVSAGNDGGAAGVNGYPAGWNNIMYNSSGKNMFAVTNISWPGKASFGCSGPFNDGRLAPQIAAEGNGGTSFASPALAGFVSVLYEAYMDSYNTTVPRSDAVKAVIMNTAQDIYKKGPDFKTGYGSINPIEAVKAIKEKHIVTGTVAQGSSNVPFEHSVSIPAGLKEFRAMLYWHDYKGTPNALKALVNDLDVKVITPAGDTLLPWVLHPAPSTVEALATRGIDTLNNQEQVTIDKPQAGTYKILVYGKSVPMGPQDYVVTYMLSDYHIKITTPDNYRLTPLNYVSGKSRIPGASEMAFGFTWDYALDTDNPADSIQIFLQRQAGTPFAQIGSVATRSIDAVAAEESASVGFYLPFNVPADFPVTSTARIIVKQKNQPYADTSGYLQYTPMVQNLSVISACPEQVTLQWDKLDSLHSGGRYVIYRLGTNLMEAVDSVDENQTTVTLQASTVLGTGRSFSNEEWFAVAARQPDGSLSYRTYPVTQRITNPMSPDPVQASFTLCKSDTAVISVDNRFIKDSVRWFKNGDMMTSGGNLDTLKLTFNDFGNYTYRSYHDGCAFESDTFYVNKSPDDLSLSDTVYTTKNLWRSYVYKGDYSNNEIYGYLDMTKTEFNLNTADYFTYANANPWNAEGYVGCPLATKDFTMIVKRNGFAEANYDIKARKGYKFVKLWVNDTLVYVAPQDLNFIKDYPVIWSGHLDMNSRVRIELRSVNVSALALDFVADRYACNLALNKPATQYTTWPSAEVTKAVDGDYTDISSTIGGDSYPYLNIDLEDSARVDYFRLWNRSDNKGVQLSKYYIFVSDAPFEESNTDPAEIAARPGMQYIYQEQQAQLPTMLVANMKGRYIRLQLSSIGGALSLSELEAFGSWLSPDSSNYENLAYQKPASQSSTYSTAVASRAVDGVTDGDYNQGSVSHTGATTETMVNPWWEVDLGSVYKLSSLHLYNRNSLQDRVKEYNIIISETPLNMSTSTTDYPGATIIHKAEVLGTPTIIPVDVKGRYVAIQIPGAEKIVQLAEVQVFGKALSDTENTALPVRLRSFTAQSEKKEVLIKWSTSHEIDLKGFDIETLDDQQFKKIGYQTAMGQGAEYRFKDLQPKVGINSYRLKMYDKDGSFEYSKVSSAMLGNADQDDLFIIQPNPVIDQLKVVKKGKTYGQARFTIFNISGARMLDWHVNEVSSMIKKDVSFLKPGLYLLKIDLKERRSQTIRFIKK